MSSIGIVGFVTIAGCEFNSCANDLSSVSIQNVAGRSKAAFSIDRSFGGDSGMQNQRIILAPSDALALRFAAEMGQLLGVEPTIHLIGRRAALPLSAPEFERVKKDNFRLIRHVGMSISGFNLSLQMNIQTSDVHGRKIAPPYGLIDTNDQNTGNVADDTLFEIERSISKFIRKNSLEIAHELEIDDTGLLKAVTTTVQTAAADQIASTNEFFQKLVVEFDNRRLQLEADTAERRRDLENDLRQKADLLQSDRDHLEAARKQLDDRNNTHARRAVVRELIETLKDRQGGLSLPRETTNLRRPLHILFLAILAATAGGALWSLSALSSMPADVPISSIILTSIKSLAFTFGFLTFAGFYLTWMSRWSDRHAEAQFQNRQFEIDINRASWAVEAALEWKGNQGDQMPEALLNGLTKGLFDFSQSRDSKEFSPLDVLASNILGSASKVDVKTPGAEMSFDRKGLRQLGKGEA